MDYFVGIDLGGTNLRAVVGRGDAPTLEASVVGRARRPTPQGPDGDTITQAVLDAVGDACEDAGVGPGDVTAAGVGTIGPLDLGTGAVVDPVNLSDAVDRIELRDPLALALDTDLVDVLNDTTAGVVGERAADPETPENVVYVTLSTGVGAGACVDGRVLVGADGNAGEIGHATLDPTGVMNCDCGAAGHWEAYCSGTHIPAYARHLHAGETETALPLDDPEFSAVDVFEHAPHDDFAAEVVAAVGSWNAIGVANLVHAYAPSRVAFGGAVALNNPEEILGSIRAELPDHCCIPVPEVGLTRLGEDVVLLGALARAIEAGGAAPWESDE